MSCPRLPKRSSQRRRKHLLGDLAAARSPTALAEAVRHRLKPDRQVVASESKSKGGGWAFWPVWVVRRRLARLASRLSDRRARREARGAAAVIRWL